MNVLDSLIYNLQTVASVRKGMKIVTGKQFLATEEESALQFYWRWKTAENRDKVVTAICKEIRTTIYLAELLNEIVAMNPKSEKKEDLGRVKIALIAAINGIDSTRATYETDANLIGTLRPLVEEIKACVENIDLNINM